MNVIIEKFNKAPTTYYEIIDLANMFFSHIYGQLSPYQDNRILFKLWLRDI